MIKKLLNVLVVLPALLFIIMGVRWVVAPAGIAPQFGFELSSGLGLSSQIGDMTGYFLTLGICMLMSVVTAQRTWFYPPILLLLITAVARTLAWLVHDAALAPAIVVEIVVSIILITAARQGAAQTKS